MALDTNPNLDESDERVTEVGSPEGVDLDRHPIALAVGLLVLVLIFALGVAGLASMLGSRETKGVEQVVVPRAAGRTAEAAQRQLERLGLIVEVRYVSNEVVPVSQVVDQSPIAGSRLDVGQLVTLQVSDGPAGVDVPDASSLSSGDAVKLLQTAGLKAEIENVFDEVVPFDTVVKSKPSAGARAAPDSTVVLKVSQGPAPRTVPAVVDLGSAEAIAALTNAELKIGDLKRQFDASRAPGTVISSSPAGGASAPRDMPVDLVIAVGPGSIHVPDLVGLTTATATRVAREEGLTVKTQRESVPTGDRRAGVVITQVQIAGSPMEKGGAIQISVGEAPPPPPPPATTTTTTTPPTSTAPPTTAG